MADIRCPLCGKPNPSDRDVCQYCQARLKPLVAPPTPASQTPPKEEAGSSTTDWLSDLRSQDGEDLGAASEASSQVISDLDDWLSRLGTNQAEASPPTKQPPTPSSSSESLPDWPTETSSPATPSPLESDSLEPEWLQRIHARQQAEKEPATQTPPAEKDEDNNKLGSTDWLASLGLTPSVPSKDEAESSLPDWLTESGTQPEPGIPATQETVPEWLREAGMTASATEEAAATESAVPADSIPDWLKAAAPPQEQPAPPSAKPFPTKILPPEPGEAPPQEELPDWFSAAATPAVNVFATPEASAETPAELPQEEATPDWIAKLGASTEPKPTESVPAFVMGEEELASLVSGDQPEFGEKTEAADLDTLPEWISQVSAETAPEEAPPPAEAETTPGLAPAELPGWLEAMRPVEAAAPSLSFQEETEGQIESAGPLAGLRGVLPAEVEIARIRKPPTYSVKLQVSESHQARVALLEELIANEGQPKPVAPYSAITSQYILRLVIAITLMVAVFGAIWMGSGQTPLPEPKNIAPEIAAARGQVEALPANSAVLVAFDYEPGLSGEMDAAASGIVSHLIEKRVPLTLVSTSPTGPMLAEHLLSARLKALNEMLLPETPFTSTLFTNLGYIPGGITGLRAFAENPSQILPRSLSGKKAWDSEPLTSEATLVSFNLVLVITENPDTARAWVEQAQAKLENTPLLMVISAQAEPMVRPYYDSGQIDGLVTGIAGSVAYENLVGQSGPASTYWDSLSASLLVAVVLILGGGLTNAILGVLARSKQKGEEHPYA